MLSIPWYFARQGQSSLFFLVYACVTVLALFWSIFAGAIVDRFSRKRVFLMTNLIEGLLIFGVAGYAWYAGDLPNGLIILVFAVTFLGFHIHYPNLYAFGQEITPPDKYVRINSQLEIVGQVTNVAAGAMAAVLLEGLHWAPNWAAVGLQSSLEFHIAAWSLSDIFLLDASTYVVAFLLIAFIRYTPYATKQVDMSRLANRLKAGFTYLRAHPKVAVFGYFSHVLFAVVLVNLLSVVPSYIENHLGAGGAVLGGVEICYALGALVAGLFVKHWFAHTTITRAVWAMMLGGFFIALTCTFTQSVIIYLAAALGYGFGNAGIRVLRITYLFERVPNGVIGRVNSVFSITNILTRSLLLFIFSLAWFEQANHVRYTYGVFAIFLLISTAVLWWTQRKAKPIPVAEAA